MVNILTEPDFVEIDEHHRLAGGFEILSFAKGGFSMVPRGCVVGWWGEERPHFKLYIGKCSGLGVGTEIRDDSGRQSLWVGRYVSGGSHLKFVLNGRHLIDRMSSYMIDNLGGGITMGEVPQAVDTVIEHDIWLGNEAMIMGGARISTGSIIGARALVTQDFTTEPYGIYVGAPARLLRFRFSEKLREKLLALRWWELDVKVVKDFNALFTTNLTQDEARSLDLLCQLAEVADRYPRYVTPFPPAPARAT